MTVMHWWAIMRYTGSALAPPKIQRCARTSARCEAPSIDARCHAAPARPCRVTTLIEERQLRIDRALDAATLRAIHTASAAMHKPDAYPSHGTTAPEAPPRR